MRNEQKIIRKIVQQSNVPNPLKFVKESVKDLCQDSLNHHIIECNDCNNNCSQKSISFGNPNASLMIIGNSFDLESSFNKRSKPFSKRDYEYINIAIKHLKINYDELFFINAVNCPNIRTMEDGSIKEMIPNSKQAANCKIFTDFAIDFVEPIAILIMSGVAVNSYLNCSPFEAQGNWFDIKGIPAMVTHDPKHFYSDAWLNRGPEFIGEKQLEFLDDIRKVSNYILETNPRSNIIKKE